MPDLPGHHDRQGFQHHTMCAPSALTLRRRLANAAKKGRASASAVPRRGQRRHPPGHRTTCPDNAGRTCARGGEWERSPRLPRAA
eukprot:2784730-Pyramimonas_sp.AAC.1